MPYVSVIIPVFNAANFVIDSYQSIVDQTMDDWELIFVNDGSRDDTLAVVRSLAAADKRIKVIDLPSNLGPAYARNAALASVASDWIALLDADDRYSRDRLEKLTSAAERTGADIVLDNQFIIDPSSNDVAFLAFEPPKDEVTTLDFSAFLRNTQSNTVFDFGYLKPIIRRRWLVANGITYQEQLRLGEDLMLLFECYARRAKVILISRPYYYYYLQYSPISKAKSPTTRTEARYEPLLAAMEQFVEKGASSHSRLEHRLIISAYEAVRETMMVTALRACLRHFDLLGIICCLRHPVRLSRGLYFAKKRSLLLQHRVKTFPRIEGYRPLGRDV
jgi:glycosyltransferase involved in cell wall biosynthesis